MDEQPQPDCAACPEGQDQHQSRLFLEKRAGKKFCAGAGSLAFIFSPAWAETMIAAIETDDTAMYTKGQS
jgi:hypothetical protein